MILILSSIVSVCIGLPFVLVSSVIGKLYYCLTRKKQIDTSRVSFINELTYFVNHSGDLKSRWIFESIHVLERPSTIFGGKSPVFIIHGTGSGSVNFIQFMRSIPKYYDVYCIDLPGWGVSNNPELNENLYTDTNTDLLIYYSKMIYDVMMEIHPYKDSKFILLGHSFGSFLLSLALIQEIIPSKKIEKCILAALPGLSPNISRYPYLWGTLFKTSILETTFKKWWAPHLFCAFLYPRPSSISKLILMQRFIPYGEGFKFASKHIQYRGLLPPVWTTLTYDSLLTISNKINIVLVCGYQDTIVSYVPLLNISHESKGNIQFYGFECGHSLFDHYPCFNVFNYIIITDKENTYKTKKVLSHKKKI